jgi:hypothetical protein
MLGPGDEDNDTPTEGDEAVDSGDSYQKDVDSLYGTEDTEVGD